jgi:glutathionyl-hydroquinone reductase
MGMMIDGVWETNPVFPTDGGGAFRRPPTTFRGQVSTDGSTPYAAQAGRYHLYVSHACPWCHRTSIVRALLGLEAAIPMTVVDPFMDDDGWHFSDREGCGPDPLFGARFARELYARADAGYTGRVTVPILWDRQTDTLVNNESSEIIRMMNGPLASLGDRELDLVPEALRDESDAWRERIYETINNGVYRCGFARSQEAYDRAVGELFATLERLEQHLDARRYLCGARLTEADVCLFVTLLRFDLVYVTHFKCNRKRLVDLPNLWAYTRDLYQLPGVAGTCHVDHIKEHYFRSHASINPTRIVPAGFDIDFAAPHGRRRLG